jgi:hypothetical protein
MTTFDTSFSLRVARSLTLPHQPQTEANDRSRVAAPVPPAQAVQVAARAISLKMPCIRFLRRMQARHSNRALCGP